MLPEEIAALPLELEQMFYDLQDRIITDVVRRIKKTGDITSTADYQLNKYNILGGTTEMIESEIKRVSGLADAKIWEIYDRVVEADYTRYKPLYEQINGSFLQYDDPENEILQSWVTGIVKQTQEGVRNISRSLGFMVDVGNGRKAFTPLAKYYQKYVDEACLDIVTGSFSYDQVMKKTVKQMTASGIQWVDYETGWHNRAPVAVRRAVLTGVHQISNNINDMVAKQLGTDYFEVTAHYGARPSHMPWQGKVYKRADLERVCGLGTVGGLCGANCRHSYYAFFPEYSVRAYTDEQLQEIIEHDMQTKTWIGVEYNGYERTQKQRQYETIMRAQRAQIKALKTAGVNKDIVQAAQAKYLNTMSEYKLFSKKMGLQPQLERVYVDGLGRMAGGRIPKKAITPQFLRPRALDASNPLKVNYLSKGMMFEVNAKKAAAYDNIYVSDKLNLKRKQLQYVNSSVKKAAKMVGVNTEYTLPRVIVCDDTELPSKVVAAYTINDNTLRISKILTSKRSTLELPDDIACSNDPISSYLHEMFHWKDAQEYITMKGTAEGYLEYNNKVCKKAVEKLIQQGYNMTEISTYAEDMFYAEPPLYYEVYTEYRVLTALR